MTQDHFPHTWSGRIVELAKIIGALTILGSTAALIWAWAYGPVGKFLDGVTEAQVSIRALALEVSQIKQDMARITGEDRVIRQTPGLSYIEEPVHEGEIVTMIMVASRTTLGRDCRLIEWTPLFTDTSGITIPGAPARDGPIRRQISQDLTRLHIEMQPPDDLKPGRVELYLALTYVCGPDERVTYDRTDPVIYELMKAE